MNSRVILAMQPSPFGLIARFRLPAAALVLAALPLSAQYVGQVTKKPGATPELRAVAVLEWTGEPGKPKMCRLVPVSIYDGDQLQDAGVYMARPQPLALNPEVEYQLKQNGKTVGLFDIRNAGQEQGSWVGFGDWKSLPKPKPAARPAKIDQDEDWSSDDKPVLHRRHKDSTGSSGTGSSSGSSGNGSGSGSGDSSGNGSGSSAPASDSDRPQLHRPNSDSSTSNGSGSAPEDPDRPVLKKPEPQKPAPSANEIGNVDPVPDSSDPDRPRLIRGQVSGGPAVTPTLMGLPPDMQQAVAVSDVKNTPDHPWDFSWANPDDEGKMKSQMEDLARQALGLTPPPAPPAPAKTAAARRAAAKKAAAPPPAHAALEDEQFRVFELAYGSGATMVLTAHTAGPAAQQKFVTLIGQPDLYGNVLVLFKNVTDGAHLDDAPRMRLVDAVDAMDDNRGELLFELRGTTQRQFALYRVLRGQATPLFTTSANPIGSMSE